jgi:hypothetical protein
MRENPKKIDQHKLMIYLAKLAGAYKKKESERIRKKERQS